MQEEITYMKQFVAEKNGFFIVTGTNIPNQKREKVLQALGLEDDPKLIPLFTSSAQSDRRDIFSSNLMHNIQGVCFIPKQLSADGRNKIIFLAQKISQAEFEESVRPADLLKSGSSDSIQTLRIELD